MTKQITLGLLLAMVLLPGIAYSQGTATLSGTVIDPSGAMIPNASVKITNAETNWTRTVVTDSNGRYFASPLPVGKYVLEVECSGFRKLTRSGIVLTADLSAHMDLKLEVGATSQSVTVHSGAPLVNVTKSTQVTLIDSARMQDLPLNGRDPLSLQALQPGVVPHSFNNSGEEPAFSINGARGTQNNYTLDGGEFE
jgi:hypothetical protein